MELLIEEVVTERELSDYEIERNKPMPTLIHGIVQANIGFELKKILWKNTDHWDELLTERAKISGRLVLSEFTKEKLKKS